jgi:hypothetical protein
MVVDFSCFIPSDMKSSTLAFESIRVGLYVYISTDSVYEVTQAKYVEEIKTDNSYDTNDSFSSFDSYSSSSSSDSIDYTIERMDEKELMKNSDYFDSNGLILEPYGFYNKRNNRFRTYLLKMDAYGLEKLQWENILTSERSPFNQNHLILRLPDVIGPYDDSARFWVIVLRMTALLELAKRKMDEVANLQFEFAQEEIDKNMSFVSCNDVSKLLNSLLLHKTEGGCQITKL